MSGGALGRLLLALALAAAPARAAGPEVWAALYNARLVESAERDSAAAVAIYETLLTHLPTEDPIRGELLYWLGRARIDAGDPAGALAALEEACGDPRVRAEARRLHARVALSQQAVDPPYLADFGHDIGAWLRGWTRGELEDLDVETVDGNGLMRWNLTVRDGEEDFIVLPVRPSERNGLRLRMVLRSEDLTAHLRVLAEDTDGRRWTAPVTEARRGEWMLVDVNTASLLPAEAPADRRRVDPAAVRAFIIRDVTAFHGETRGDNRIYIDDVSLR